MDNPAGRLETLLSAFRAKKDESIAVHQAWARVLDVQEGDVVELGRRMAPIFTLPNEIRTQIESIEDINHELLLRHLPQAEAALSNSLLSMGSGIQKVTAHYDDRTLYSLESCSYELHRHRPESVISDEQIKDIARRTRELIDCVLDSDMDDDVREFILKHLRAIEEAIQNIRIRGTGPLLNAVDQVYGSILRRGEIWERLKAVEPIFTILGALIAAIALAVQVSLPALTPTPTGPLPSIQPPSEVRIQRVSEDTVEDAEVVDPTDISLATGEAASK